MIVKILIDILNEINPQDKDFKKFFQTSALENMVQKYFCREWHGIYLQGQLNLI